MALLVALLVQEAPSMADLIARWKSDDAAVREKADAEILERWSAWKDDDFRRLEDASRGEEAEVASRAKSVLARLRVRRRAGAALVAKYPRIDAVFTKGDERERLDLLSDASSAELAEADLRTLVALALECEWTERGEAVASLGARVEAYRPLLTAMFRHAHAAVRTRAAEIARELESPELAGAIVPLLKDAEPRVRKEAAKGIGYQKRVNLVEHVLPLLKDSDARVREQALDAVLRLGGPPHAEAVAPLLKDADDDVRRQAVDTYGVIAPPSGAEPLIALLKGELRADAAQILGRMNARQHAGAIVPLLEDELEGVRLQAVRALGVLGAAEAEEAVARLLKDPSELVRASAALSLGEMLAERRAGDLKALLKDKSTYVRISAAEALCDFGTPPDLAVLLQDPEIQVRGWTARIVGREGWREHAGALAPLLEDDTSWVALDAASALRSLGRTEEGARLVPWLKDAYAGKRLRAIVRLVELGDRRAEIAALVRDPDADVRAFAAEAVGVLGLKADGLEALAADQAPEVRAAAVFAMARLGLEGAERRCAEAERAKDWRVATAGSLGLARLGKKPLVEVMRRLEPHWVYMDAPFADELWETLECLYEPRVAERLGKPVQTSKVVSTLEDAIDELKRASGLRLVIDRERKPSVRLRGLLRKGWHGTAETLLERIVRWAGMKVVVAGDEVRVMSRREALLYWIERLSK